MRMIQALSKYLRLSLAKGQEIVTVEDELENVKSYMGNPADPEIRICSPMRWTQVDASETFAQKLILDL